MDQDATGFSGCQGKGAGCNHMVRDAMSKRKEDTEEEEEEEEWWHKEGGRRRSSVIRDVEDDARR
eukprot:3323700-Pyramimonas_sp.AAC.1